MRLDTVLKQLEAGTLSLDDAVAQVRSMKLPPAQAQPLTTAQVLEKPDPRPPRKGSFFAVSAAYQAGRISDAEYTALAEAAADAAGRGDSSGAGGSGSAPGGPDGGSPSAGGAGDGSRGGAQNSPGRAQ